MSIFNLLARKSSQPIEQNDPSFLLEEEITPVVQKQLFIYARHVLQGLYTPFDEEEVVEREIDACTQSLLSRQVNVGVALWVGGRLRGSYIVIGRTLRQALQESIFQAAWDARFKPIVQNELYRVRIEMTLFSKLLRVDLRQWQEQGFIDTTRGYQIVSGTHSGWFLPEVFNCIRFQGTSDFLRILIEQKAGLNNTALLKSDLRIFSVVDFIESADTKSILRLSGPLVKNTKIYSDFESLFLEDLRRVLAEAACHLMYIQEEDGNFPPIINPLSGKKSQIDWIRLAGTASALAMLGKTMKNQTYQQAADKAGKYIEKYGYQHPSLNLYTRTLHAIYYAEYLYIVGRKEEAKSIAQTVSDQIHSIKFEPILFLKAASLLLTFGEDVFFVTAEKLFKLVWNDFQYLKQQGKVFQLALYPELIPVALQLERVARKEDYQRKARYITDWYLSQQQADGSFSSNIKSRFSYTRGTGKIFEVLALNPVENKSSLLRAFSWLRDMQYTQENTYFVDEAYRDCIVGGFRHDVLNQEVWIDASVHVLIGGARILDVFDRVV